LRPMRGFATADFHLLSACFFMLALMAKPSIHDHRHSRWIFTLYSHCIKWIPPNRAYHFLGKARRSLITRAMEMANGNKTAAARLLGITPQAIHNYLRRGTMMGEAHLLSDIDRGRQAQEMSRAGNTEHPASHRRFRLTVR